MLKSFIFLSHLNNGDYIYIYIYISRTCITQTRTNCTLTTRTDFETLDLRHNSLRQNELLFYVLAWLCIPICAYVHAQTHIHTHTHTNTHTHTHTHMYGNLTIHSQAFHSQIFHTGLDICMKHRWNILRMEFNCNISFVAVLID